MRIVREEIGEITVFIVNLDRATLNDADEMKRMVVSAIDSGCKKLIIDLSACEFIDSTFLGVLVSALKRIVKAGGELRLVGFRPAVETMFELTRMYRVFSIYNDLKEALSSFGK